MSALTTVVPSSFGSLDFNTGHHFFSNQSIEYFILSMCCICPWNTACLGSIQTIQSSNHTEPPQSCFLVWEVHRLILLPAPVYEDIYWISEFNTVTFLLCLHFCASFIHTDGNYFKHVPHVTNSVFEPCYLLLFTFYWLWHELLQFSSCFLNPALAFSSLLVILLTHA